MTVVITSLSSALPSTCNNSTAPGLTNRSTDYNKGLLEYLHNPQLSRSP